LALRVMVPLVGSKDPEISPSRVDFPMPAESYRQLRSTPIRADFLMPTECCQLQLKSSSAGRLSNACRIEQTDEVNAGKVGCLEPAERYKQ